MVPSMRSHQVVLNGGLHLLVASDYRFFPNRFICRGSHGLGKGERLVWWCGAALPASNNLVSQVFAV